MGRRLSIGLALAVAAAGSFAGAVYAHSLFWTIVLGCVGLSLVVLGGGMIRSDLPGTRTGELDRFTSTFRGF